MIFIKLTIIPCCKYRLDTVSNDRLQESIARWYLKQIDATCILLLIYSGIYEIIDNVSYYPPLQDHKSGTIWSSFLQNDIAILSETLSQSGNIN